MNGQRTDNSILVIAQAALKLQSGQLNMPQLGCYVFRNLNKNAGIKY